MLSSPVKTVNSPGFISEHSTKMLFTAYVGVAVLSFFAIKGYVSPTVMGGAALAVVIPHGAIRIYNMSCLIKHAYQAGSIANSCERTVLLILEIAIVTGLIYANAKAFSGYAHGPSLGSSNLGYFAIGALFLSFQLCRERDRAVESSPPKPSPAKGDERKLS